MRFDADRYIGAVMTVRNEHDLLRNNILFHRLVGIDRFYIYLDHPTDSSARTVGDLDCVSINHSRLPNWLTQQEVSNADHLSRRFHTHHTARQLINCHDAVRRAREEGVQWLVSIDPDELISLDDQFVRARCLADYLSQLPQSVETVTFPANEVLSTRNAYQNVFAEEVRFKRRYGYGEGLRANSGEAPYRPEWHVSPLKGSEYTRKVKELDPAFSTCAWLDVENTLIDVPCMMLNLGLDAAEGYELVTDWFIGHVIGKQAFRVSNTIDFRSLHTVRLSTNGQNHVQGRLLHYNCYSFAKFLSKFRSFRNHPNSYTRGSPVDRLKLALRDIVNNSGLDTRERLQQLFESQFSFQGRRLSAISSLWPGSVVTVLSVAEAFQSRLGCQIT